MVGGIEGSAWEEEEEEQEQEEQEEQAQREEREKREESVVRLLPFLQLYQSLWYSHRWRLPSMTYSAVP